MYQTHSPLAGILVKMLFIAVLALLVMGGISHAQTETALYAFCSQAYCVDGITPNGALAMDAEGNLYGTTLLGGTPGY